MNLSQSVFVDANLLVLLVVGTFRKHLIEKHKKCRSQQFTVKDFDLLLALILSFEAVALTPNTLTETSNLLRSHDEPEKSLLTSQLGTIIQAGIELYVSSANASQISEFPRLGLTDAALLHAIIGGGTLVSTDAILCITAQRMGLSAINFTHARIEAGLIDPA